MSPQPKKPVDSKRTAREKAAEARAGALAAERRRDRTVRLVGAVVVLAVVGVIVAMVILGQKKAPAVNANAALPKGVNSVDYGVKYGTAPATAPRLDLWEDFQCPICKDFETANGASLKALADAGKVQLYWHPANFIEAKFPNSNLSSTRAAYAWGCAIDSGKVTEYHSGIFAMQNKTEGGGYTDTQFLNLAQQVGIAGNDFSTFQTCFTGAKYQQWVINSENEFQQRAVPGTPTGYLNGVEIQSATLFSPSALAAAIAAAGPAPTPSHS